MGEGYDLRRMALAWMTITVTLAGLFFPHDVRAAAGTATITGTIRLLPQPWAQTVTVHATASGGPVFSSPAGTVQAAAVAPGATSATTLDLPFALNVTAPDSYQISVKVQAQIPGVGTGGAALTHQDTFYSPRPVAAGVGQTVDAGTVSGWLPAVQVTSATTALPRQSVTITLALPDARAMPSAFNDAVIVQAPAGVALQPISMNTVAAVLLGPTRAIDLAPVTVSDGGLPAGSGPLATDPTPISFTALSGIVARFDRSTPTATLSFVAANPGVYPLYITDGSGHLVRARVTITVPELPPLAIIGTVRLLPQPWPQTVTVSATGAQGGVASTPVDTVPATQTAGQPPTATVDLPFLLAVPQSDTYQVQVQVQSALPSTTEGSLPAVVVDPLYPLASTATVFYGIPADVGHLNAWLNPWQIAPAQSTVALGQSVDLTVRSSAHDGRNLEPMATAIVAVNPGATLAPGSTNAAVAAVAGLNIRAVELAPVTVSDGGSSLGTGLQATGTKARPITLGSGVTVTLGDPGDQATVRFKADVAGFYDVFVLDSQTRAVLARATVGAAAGSDVTRYIWQKQYDKASSHLWGVAFPDNLHGWAVGEDGLVLTTSDGGLTWMERAIGQPRSVNWNVQFSDVRHGWILSHSGGSDLILGTSDGGATWSQYYARPGDDLRYFAFADPLHGWAVGANGTILHSADGGFTWAPQNSGTQNGLNAVSFVDALHGWAVGREGTILSTENGGINWTAQTSGTAADLMAAAFVDAIHGWAAGGNGTLLTTTDGGLHWSPQDSGSSFFLTRLAFTDGLHGWAVGFDTRGGEQISPGDPGRGSVILATADGGAHWTAQKAPPAAQIFSAAFPDGTHGWAVSLGGQILGYTLTTPQPAPPVPPPVSGPPVTPPAAPFTDLEGYGWAESAIVALAAQGLVNGVGPGRFDPGGTVTRAQFAALVQRTFKLPQPAQHQAYVDVQDGDWFAGAVAAVNPYLPGVSAFGFGPSQSVDRQTVAGVMVKLLAAQGKLALLSDEAALAALAAVPDAGSITPGLEPYVATAVLNNIMVGLPDGSFSPQGPLNRAQMAVLLQRIIARYGRP